MVIDAKQAAERLSNFFFIESVDELEVGITGMGEYEVIDSNADNGGSDFPGVLENGISKAVKALKNQRGPDGISEKVLKILWHMIGSSVTSLIKANIHQRVMPREDLFHFCSRLFR